MKRAADRRARRRARGFTLIEMLVAIALLAVIALLSWRGLDATIRGRDSIASNLTQTRLLGRYFSQLQFDLLNLVTADEVFGPPLRIARTNWCSCGMWASAAGRRTCRSCAIS